MYTHLRKQYYQTQNTVFYSMPKKICQSEARKPWHILRYAKGNMQRVVFHYTFPLLLASNSLENASVLLKTFPRSAPMLFNRTFAITDVRKFSDDFRTLPKIFKNHKNFSKTVLNRIRKFPKILKPAKVQNRFGSVSKFPRISELFRKIL